MGCVSKAVSSDSIDFRRTAKEKTKTFCRWSKGYHHRYKAALGGYQSGTGSGKKISRKESLPEQGCVENGSGSPGSSTRLFSVIEWSVPAKAPHGSRPDEDRAADRLG